MTGIKCNEIESRAQRDVDRKPNTDIFRPAVAILIKVAWNDRSVKDLPE